MNINDWAYRELARRFQEVQEAEVTRKEVLEKVARKMDDAFLKPVINAVRNAMTEGRIPINPSDLPTESIPLEESAVYTGELRRVTLSQKLSRKDVMFCAVQVEIVDGDFEGATVMLNYLPVPVPIHSDASKGEKYRLTDQNKAFARFARAFKVNSEMPDVTFGDLESMEAWHQWIAQYEGATGRFTVKNQEFPEGSGRLRSGISDFIY